MEAISSYVIIRNNKYQNHSQLHLTFDSINSYHSIPQNFLLVIVILDFNMVVIVTLVGPNKANNDCFPIIMM